MTSKHQELLDALDAFQAVTGHTDSSLSKRIFGVSRTIRRLREGAAIQPKTCDRGLRWLAENPAETYRKLHPRGPKMRFEKMEMRRD